MADIKRPVLIIGAGLAGLTAATLLAWRGVPCILVERRPSTSRHPRARGVNLRTLELLRQVPGLEDDLRKAGRPGLETFSMVIAETVTGRPIKTLMEPGVFDTRALSPAAICAVGQDRIEPVLLRHARALGADVRFSTEVIAFAQTTDGVDVTVRDCGGAERPVRADYVIAADGARSPTRQKLGITTRGRGTLSHNMSILFETDLGFLADRGFALFYLQNPGFTGAFVTTDDIDRGQVSVEYDPARETAADYTPDRCVFMVRAALGLPDAAVKIVDAMPWEMTSRIVDQMRVGRVFLAGDAAHTMPPTGGLGGQTAMQDAADLAWKLALVVQGQADAALLDTYESERLPVARITVARQTEHYVERMRPDRTDLADADVERDYMAVALGYRYRSAAIQDDPADGGSRAESPIHPSFRPGTRIGHVTLEREGAPISTLDLVGHGFVLLAGRRGGAWLAAAGVCAAAGLPVVGCRIGSDLVDPDDAFATRAGLVPEGAILLRPDGFIAWRFDTGHANPKAALETALARVLCRPRHAPAQGSLKAA